MRHFKIIFEPDGRQISIHSGATILEAAEQLGIILNTICGGQGTCGKCVVRIEQSGQEVLACRYKINSDLTVTIPQTSRFFEQKILEHGASAKTEFQPDIYKRYLKFSDENRIFGVSLDIGTTTIVAKLINLRDANSIAVESDYNPQMRYGDDVISRISYADDEQKLAELQRIIIGCVNSLINKLCEKASVSPHDIYELTAVGNTAMNHIFLGLPVKQLGQAPYNAYSLDAHDLKAEELGISINPQAVIHTVENIAGFVGSDTTAAVLAGGMDLAEQISLLIDIGTNGEVVLGTKDKLLCASCAAGPAFEGARISSGSRAIRGAVESVILDDDDIDIDVIGDCSPVSLCGSGLLDAAAVLLDLGVIDSSGRFIQAQPLRDKLPPKIFRRVIQKDSQPAFVIAFDKENNEPSVVITQKDIRELQLAKAAIRTGIYFLMKNLNISDSDIGQVFLAGAFGNYLRKDSALRIGLLPKVAPEKIHFIGNAALEGAQIILRNSLARELAGKLARGIKYVEIANQPDFADVYAGFMFF
ncbi:MAG: ASKHA domain-containing protein [Phycisphaerae bacterium]